MSIYLSDYELYTSHAYLHQMSCLSFIETKTIDVLLLSRMNHQHNNGAKNVLRLSGGIKRQLNCTYVELRPLRRNIRQAFPLYRPRAKATCTRAIDVCKIYIHKNKHALTPLLCNTDVHMSRMVALLNIIYCNLSEENTLINACQLNGFF